MSGTFVKNHGKKPGDFRKVLRAKQHETLVKAISRVESAEH